MNQNISEEQTNIDQDTNNNPSESNLPLEEKIQSSNPQTRKAAYDEISLTNQIAKFDYAIPTFLSDSSSISLQSALGLVLSLLNQQELNQYNATPDQVKSWSKIIIEQTYGCNHIQCQDLCKELMCQLLSIDYKSVIESIKGVMTKNVKAIRKIMQSEILLDHLIDEFGSEIGFGDIDEVIKGLTLVTNPGVRNYAMTIMRNIYTWDEGNKVANEVLKDKEKEAINDKRIGGLSLQPKRKIKSANNVINEDKGNQNEDISNKDKMNNDTTIKQPQVAISKEEANNTYNKDNKNDNNNGNSDNNDNDKLLSYYTSNEFLDKLVLKHQKAIEKKKLLEELLSFLLNQHEPIESNLSFNQYSNLLSTLHLILNENNAHVITASIGLLSYFSKLFLHNAQYVEYLTDLIPKILDKFNLQSNAINDTVHKLLNEVIEYNLSFNTFYAYLANISIDDNVNYTINLLTFAFEQIKRDESINIKSISNDLVDLFRKLSVEDSNEISNLAFNILEMLNMRNYLAKEKVKDIEKEVNEEDKHIKAKDDIEEKLKKKGDGKSFRIIKKKKGAKTKNNNDDIENIDESKETKIEGEVNDNSTMTPSQLKTSITVQESHSRVLSSKHLNYDNIVIGSGKNKNPTNEELMEATTFQITKEEDNNTNTFNNPPIEELRAPSISTTITNSYDERVVGGKSSFNQLFSDEIEKLDKVTPSSLPLAVKNKPKPKKNAMTVEEMAEMYNKKQPKEPQFQSSDIKPIESFSSEGPKTNDNTKDNYKSIDDMPIPVKQTQEEQGQVDIDNEPINTKESQRQALEDFQKKVDLALQQQQDKEANNNYDNCKPSNDSTPQVDQKKPLKDETQFEEIKSLLGPDTVSNLSDSKWELKKQGLEQISKYIQSQSQSLSSSKSDDLYSYIKFKLTNFKETNFNVNREAITLFTFLFTNTNLSYDSKHYLQVLDAYYDKYSDGKLKEQVNQLLLTLIDIQGPSTVVKALLSKLQKKPNVNLYKDYSIFLSKCIEDYDVNQLPIKDMVDLCKAMASNSNPQVRTASTALLCVLYAYIGNDIKVLIKDIKESTLKVIETELSKVTVIDNANKKKTTKPQSSSNTNANANQDLNSDSIGKQLPVPMPNELIPRVDISKKVTAKLIKDISDGKWPEKKEACESIEKIITDANMKILPNGLNDLFNLIKTKLSDSNKNIVKMIIGLLNKLIESLGAGFKLYTKPIALALLPNFADKMQTIRDECHLCCDKWIQCVGYDTLVYFIPQFIKTDNFDIRTELMRLMMKNKEGVNKAMGETLFKDMVSPLLLCLQDRAVSVRIAAEEMIVFSLQYIGLNLYYKGLKDFKPAIVNDLRALLDKVKSEDDISNDKDKEKDKGGNTEDYNSIEKKEQYNSNSNVVNTQDCNQDKEKQLGGEKKGNCIRIAKRKKNQLSNDDVSKMIKKPNNNNSNSTPTNTDNNKLESSSATLTSNSAIIKSPTANKASSIFSTAKKSSQPKQLQIFQQPTLMKQSKEKRLEVDKKYKFSLETQTSDLELKLKDQVKGLFTEDFIKKLFNEDFKQIVEAISFLKSSISLSLSMEKDDSTILILDNLDLILKIIGLKANSNQNPSMLKSVFDFLDVLYSKISSMQPQYQLNDTEINIIIILLVDKLSMLNSSSLRELLDSLISRYFVYITPIKSLCIAFNFALGRNAKIKSEVIDICSDMYIKEQLDVTMMTKPFAKLLSKFLLANDNNVKFKTIDLFKEIYAKIGDELWGFIDSKGKEREILEANLYQDNDDEDDEYNGDEEYNNNNEGRDSDADDNNENSNIVNTNANAKGNVSNGISQQTNTERTNNNNNTNYINGQSSSCSSSSNTNTNTNTNTTPTLSRSNVKIKDKVDLLKTFNKLTTNDIQEAVNTIILVHDIICAKYEENKDLLISNINLIIKTFIEVLHKLFSVKNINDIPFKFTKYLATVLCKIASNEELIISINYEILFKLTEEILSDLLVENLDRIGENQEGVLIFKSLNSTMLRLLENCNSTHVIITLLELIKTYRIKESNLAGLAIKCLLKINQNIQHIITNIEIDKVLLQFHLLLCSFDTTPSDLQVKTQIDQMILRYIKNFLNEIVKIKKEEVVNDYILGVSSHPVQDKCILKWIKNVLTSMNIKAEHLSDNLSTEGNTIGNSNSNSVNIGNVDIKPNYETVHTTENIKNRIGEQFSMMNKKEMTPDRDRDKEKKGGIGKRNDMILDELKSRMMKQQNLMKGNRNVNSSNASGLNSHNLNNTITELKKKWNDVNKKSKGSK